jgi:hypothetical protein
LRIILRLTGDHGDVVGVDVSWWHGQESVWPPVVFQAAEAVEMQTGVTCAQWEDYILRLRAAPDLASIPPLYEIVPELKAAIEFRGEVLMN